MDIAISFCCLCLLFLSGKFLWSNIKFLRNFYIPTAILAGVLGLVILQTTGKWIPDACTMGWSKLPGFLINIVFATLFLGVSIPKMPVIWKESGPQLVYGQIVAWGQYVVGLGAAVFLLKPLFDTPGYYGTIIPVAFEGGHGTAAGLRDTFNNIGWADGAEYAMAAATIGVVTALFVGMILINWAVRTGVVPKLKNSEIPDDASKRVAIGYQTVNAASIDTLTWHIVVIGGAILVGVIIKQLFTWLVSVAGLTSLQSLANAFPLFPLCMIGGVLVQKLFSTAGKEHLIDRTLMISLSGAALDFLIVSAIAMIKLNLIMDGIVPFGIIVIAAVAWNVFCVLFLAKRLLPDAWFERAIVEMGQSMGVTATGLLLLRTVDPDHETPAYYAFGYKQLLHEPFMGGGLWTSIAIPFAVTYSAVAVLGVSVAAMVFWVIMWFILFKKKFNNAPQP